MSDPKKPDDEPKVQTPADAFAAATAVGFAMASSALEMWFGVVSGVARASQEMLERQNKKEGPPAYSPDPKPAATVAKAAARTVIAEFERATKSVVEAATQVADGPAKPAAPVRKPKPAPVVKAAEPAAEAKPSNVVPLKPEVVAEAVAAPPAAPVEKPAPEPAVETAPVAKSEELPVIAQVEISAEQPAPVEELPVAVVESPVIQPAPVEAVELVAEAPVQAPKAKAKTKAAKPAAAATVEPSAPASPAADILPEDFRAPPKADKPEAPDDLKLLPGVGPKLEQVLNGLGVWTFAQVAAWAPEEVAYVEDMTGLNGRIAADKWLEQAESLSKDTTKH